MCVCVIWALRAQSGENVQEGLQTLSGPGRQKVKQQVKIKCFSTISTLFRLRSGLLDPGGRDDSRRDSISRRKRNNILAGFS